VESEEVRTTWGLHELGLFLQIREQKPSWSEEIPMHFLKRNGWGRIVLAAGMLLVGGLAFNYGADEQHQHGKSPPAGPVNTTPDRPTGDNRDASLADQIEAIPPEDTTGLVSRMKCDGAVCALAFSPDGQLLASGSTDKLFRMWNPSNGSEAKHLTGHNCCVVSVSFAPDGNTVATASKDHSIRIWDVATGNEVRQIAERDRIYSVAYSPDGKVLASGGHDDTVRLWDPSTGYEVRRMYGHNGWVKAVTFSPKGKLLASASTDGTVRFWNPETGRQLRILHGHTDRVDSLAFSPDGSVLASAGRGGSVRLWDTAKFRQLGEIQADPEWVHGVAFSPKSRLLATGGQVSASRLWDPLNGKPGSAEPKRFADVHAVAFSPNGQLLAAGRTDGTILVRNVPALEEPVRTKPDDNRLGQAKKDEKTRRSAYPPQETQPEKGEVPAPDYTSALNDGLTSLSLALRALNPSYAIAPAVGLNSATAGSFYVQVPPGAAVPGPTPGSASDPNRGIERFNGIRRVNELGSGPRLGLPAASVACCPGRAVEFPSWLYTGTVHVKGAPGLANQRAAAIPTTTAPR
jgi:WD40 repeat protein